MTITGHNVTKLAAAAGVSPMTVRRYLRGESTRATTREHIERGLRELGMRNPHGMIKVNGVEVGQATRITVDMRRTLITPPDREPPAREEDAR